jgi:hypothetical protein
MIAQQDNLVIEAGTAEASLTAETKQKLISCITSGTASEVILITTEATGKVNASKLLSWLVDDSGATTKYKVDIINSNTGEIVAIELN